MKIRECDISALNVKNIQDFKDIPEVCKGDFNCSKNPRLKSLKGAPRIVEGAFTASDCDLRSLEYGPEKADVFIISNNKNLKSLKGGPREVNGSYFAINCGLKSLEYLPEKITEYFNLHIEKNPDLTVDSIFKQKNFRTFFKNLKKYLEVRADKEIQEFLEFLKVLSSKDDSIPVEKLRLLWKTKESLK